MSNINIDKIFSLFQEQEQENEFNDFKNDGFYYILMFKKIVNNYLKTKHFYSNTIKKTHPELNEQEINKAGDYLFFNRAFYYLNELHELNTQEELYISVSDIESFKKALEYFESVEEYEKCSIIKKIMNNLIQIKE